MFCTIISFKLYVRLKCSLHMLRTREIMEKPAAKTKADHSCSQVRSLSLAGPLCIRRGADHARQPRIAFFCAVVIVSVAPLVHPIHRVSVRSVWPLSSLWSHGDGRWHVRRARMGGKLTGTR